MQNFDIDIEIDTAYFGFRNAYNMFYIVCESIGGSTYSRYRANSSLAIKANIAIKVFETTLSYLENLYKRKEGRQDISTGHIEDCHRILSDFMDIFSEEIKSEAESVTGEEDIDDERLSDAIFGIESILLEAEKAMSKILDSLAQKAA